MKLPSFIYRTFLQCLLIISCGAYYQSFNPSPLYLLPVDRIKIVFFVMILVGFLLVDASLCEPLEDDTEEEKKPDANLPG